ncbi:MAG TPA: hypothetical protein VMG58_10035, partial [Candidatus Sulfotelmatobacter sp.]|nr:hypothetical protein [Candidatus Sulfotelmatobacter sp.]
MKIAMRLAAALLISMLCGLPAASAAEYPSKPVTVIVTVSPGGSNDIQTRAFASLAEKILKQPLVVLNKPQASGMLGDREHVHRQRHAARP